MDIPRGYTCRIQRGKVYEVDGRLSKSQQIAFVKEILRIKAMLKQTLDLINDNKLNNLFNDDDDNEDEPDHRSSTPPPFTSPKTFTTPHTPRELDKILKYLHPSFGHS